MIRMYFILWIEQWHPTRYRVMMKEISDKAD